MNHCIVIASIGWHKPTYKHNGKDLPKFTFSKKGILHLSLLKIKTKNCMVVVINAVDWFLFHMHVSELDRYLSQKALSACLYFDHQSPPNYKAIIKSVQFLIHFRRTAGINLRLFFSLLNYFCNYCCILWAEENVFLLRIIGEFAQGQHKPNWRNSY